MEIIPQAIKSGSNRGGKTPSRLIEFKFALVLWLIVTTAVGGSMIKAASDVLDGIIYDPEVEKKLESIASKGIPNNGSGVKFDWEAFAYWAK